MIYERIEGHRITPMLLGHLTKKGRVIGFVMASIVWCRHATLKDLDVCQTALARLDQLATKHGDTNKHNFDIRQGTATLIDFDNASETALTSELEEELHHLQDNLGDVFDIGGRCVKAAKGENPSLYDHLWA
jgi:hypothetical protein